MSIGYFPVWFRLKFGGFYKGWIQFYLKFLSQILVNFRTDKKCPLFHGIMQSKFFLIVRIFDNKLD